MLFDMIGGLGHMVSQGVASGMRAVADALSPAKSQPDPQALGAVQGASMARDARLTSQPHGATPTAFGLRDMILASVDRDGNGRLSRAEVADFLSDLLEPDVRPALPTAPQAPVRSPGGPVEGRTFREVDLDGDGRVTAAEVKAHAMRKALDTAGDGSISKREYLSGVRGEARALRDQAFDRMDRDGDGALSDGELVRGVTPSDTDQHLAHGYNQAALRRSDLNGDGMVEGKELAIRAALDRADASGDQALDFEEYLQAFRVPLADREAARARFKALDKDGDGRLDTTELRQAVQPTQGEYRLAAERDDLLRG